MLTVIVGIIGFGKRGRPRCAGSGTDDGWERIGDDERVGSDAEWLIVDSDEEEADDVDQEKHAGEESKAVEERAKVERVWEHVDPRIAAKDGEGDEIDAEREREEDARLIATYSQFTALLNVG